MLLELLLKKKNREKLPWLIQLPLAHIATITAKNEFIDSFDKVETYCTFIGYSRSGHSLVAALLDAHPNIVMAHELRALKYIKHAFDRNALYYLLYQGTRVRGHSWQRKGGYTYDVPNQWQGAFKDLKVIGNKHGEFTIRYLAANSNLLPKLQKVVGVPVKFIHVVRNPFDNIATIAIRTAGEKGKEVHSEIENSIEHYFWICQAVLKVKAMVEVADVFDLRHEDFVKEPQEQLRQLCLWLDVEPSSNYLADCKKIVFESPRKSRHKIQWTDELKQQVQNKIATVPFLEGYTFDN